MGMHTFNTHTHTHAPVFKKKCLKQEKEKRKKKKQMNTLAVILFVYQSVVFPLPQFCFFSAYNRMTHNYQLIFLFCFVFSLSFFSVDHFIPLWPVWHKQALLLIAGFSINLGIKTFSSPSGVRFMESCVHVDGFIDRKSLKSLRHMWQHSLPTGLKDSSFWDPNSGGFVEEWQMFNEYAFGFS